MADRSPVIARLGNNGKVDHGPSATAADPNTHRSTSILQGRVTHVPNHIAEFPTWTW